MSSQVSTIRNKLSQWLEDNFKHVTLKKELVNNGSIIKVNPVNIDLTVGLISTSSKEDFQKLVFHYAPAGTIIDEVSDEWYEGHILLVRNMLAKMLLEESNAKIADKYMSILERRDKDRWSKDVKKQTEVKAQSGNVNFEFTIVE